MHIILQLINHWFQDFYWIKIFTSLNRKTQWLTAGRWFYPGTPVSSIHKTDRHDITETLTQSYLTKCDRLEDVQIVNSVDHACRHTYLHIIYLQDSTEILFKVALNTITLTLTPDISLLYTRRYHVKCVLASVTLIESSWARSVFYDVPLNVFVLRFNV